MFVVDAELSGAVPIRDRLMGTSLRSFAHPTGCRRGGRGKRPWVAGDERPGGDGFGVGGSGREPPAASVSTEVLAETAGGSRLLMAGASTPATPVAGVETGDGHPCGGCADAGLGNYGGCAALIHPTPDREGEVDARSFSTPRAAGVETGDGHPCGGCADAGLGNYGGCAALIHPTPDREGEVDARSFSTPRAAGVETGDGHPCGGCADAGLGNYGGCA